MRADSGTGSAMGQPPITAPHPLIHFPPRFPDCSELRSSQLPDAPFLRLHGAGRSPLLLATAAGFVGSPPPSIPGCCQEAMLKALLEAKHCPVLSSVG